MIEDRVLEDNSVLTRLLTFGDYDIKSIMKPRKIDEELRPAIFFYHKDQKIDDSLPLVVLGFKTIKDIDGIIDRLQSLREAHLEFERKNECGSKIDAEKEGISALD